MKLNASADSGIYFRCSSTPTEMIADNIPGACPAGYETNATFGPVESRESPPYLTGSLWAPAGEVMACPKKNLVKPDQWFILDVVARGSHIVIKVNGTTTVDHTDSTRLYTRGCLAIQAWSETTVVHVRKIEIREPVSKNRSPETLPPTFKNSIGMEFVTVPKGKSWLGGGKDELGDKEVEIPADFYLGKYEVTQEEWTQVMGENPSHFSRTGEGKDAVKDISDADLKRFPVETVSWDQCQDFVAKLNQREKEAGWVYRLPTEVEWEYACRGGPMADKADSAFDFYFAKPTNTLEQEQANFMKGMNRSCKVGSYEANRLGLFDTHGNVLEWCDDIKKTADGALHRLRRGGGWDHPSADCLAKLGIAIPPSDVSYSLGLRLVRVPSGAVSHEAKAPPIASAPFDAARAKTHQEAWAKHLGVPVEYTNRIGMKFRLIPPGEFTMGTSPEDAAKIIMKVPEWARERVLSETPARNVRIAEPFYLGTTEVTVGQFKQFVAATKYKTHAETNGKGGQAWTGEKHETKPEFTWRHPDLTQSDAHPVGQLCAADANAFCSWLESLEGRTYRLPEEDQWEYACRAGTVTGWSCSSDPETLKQHALIGWDLTFTGRKVAQKPANPFGLFDVHGNLEELCRCKDGGHITRGGHTGTDPLLVRSASRMPLQRLDSNSLHGFRVAIVGDLKQKVAPP